MPAYRTRDASARSKYPQFVPAPPPRSTHSPSSSLSSASSSVWSESSSNVSAYVLPARPAVLEVSTDAPLPPTVSIISPTPRAFTFPITDTRFPTSPSSSPFEPTLKTIPSTPPPLRPFSPTSSIGSDSSISVLSSPTAQPSSQASSHRRRRSTASDVGERRPKKGDDDYIKRPENAFILFRRRKCEERQAAQEEDDGASGPVKKQRQADLSKTISQQWKGLSAEERQYWEELAKEKKREHEAMYPNYVYRPQRTKDKKGKKGKSRGGEHDTDSESFSFLMPVSSSPPRSLSRDFAPAAHGHTHGRRAASAPTPPPASYAIQLPSVWMPSCPTSPMLVPRISGRSPAPVANIPAPTESAPLTTFDYAPNDHLFTPSYQPQPAFDGSTLQPSDIYQNMFEMSAHGGPLLHALTIPQRDPNAHTMSPADAIASSLVSPTDTYSSGLSPTSSHGGPFTPADALRMMSLVQKDVPDGIDDDAGELPQPFGFWPTDTLWANMEGLMPDFSLASIPPVELGLGQFEAIPQPGSNGGGCGEYSMAGFPADAFDYAVDGTLPPTEEHDFDDTQTPGGGPGQQQGYGGMFHEQW